MKTLDIFAFNFVPCIGCIKYCIIHVLITLEQETSKQSSILGNCNLISFTGNVLLILLLLCLVWSLAKNKCTFQWDVRRLKRVVFSLKSLRPRWNDANKHLTLILIHLSFYMETNKQTIIITILGESAMKMDWPQFVNMHIAQYKPVSFRIWNIYRFDFDRKTTSYTVSHRTL